MNTVWLGAMLALLQAPSAPATRAAPQQNAAPVTIQNAEQFALTSAAGQEYRIYVYRPAGEPPVDGFAVMYFTDANEAFPLAVALHKTLGRTASPTVLVGIGYPTDDRAGITKRRTLDLTPLTPAEVILEFQQERRATVSNAQRPKAPPSVAPSEIKTGGKDDLFRFLQDELKPAIEERVRIDRNRQTLFGHSYGGVFALHACLEHPESFQTFVVSSPSLWLNPAAQQQAEASFAAALDQLPTKPRLMLSADDQERTAKTSDATAAGPSGAEAVAARLEKLGLDATFQKFTGGNHGSVVPRAMMQALRAANGSPNN